MQVNFDIAVAGGAKHGQSIEVFSPVFLLRIEKRMLGIRAIRIPMT
jgi:hypothetical protein